MLMALHHTGPGIDGGRFMVVDIRIYGYLALRHLGKTRDEAKICCGLKGRMDEGSSRADCNTALKRHV